MTNSDTAFGLHNKITKIYTALLSPDGGDGTDHHWGGGGADQSEFSTKSITFTSVEEGQNYFFTTNALACMNECATRLEWAVVPNGLKFTIAFGIPSDSSVESWSTKWRRRKKELHDAHDWCKLFIWHPKFIDGVVDKSAPESWGPDGEFIDGTICRPGTRIEMWRPTDSTDHLF